jgi:hypothetical protein
MINVKDFSYDGNLTFGFNQKLLKPPFLSSSRRLNEVNVTRDILNLELITDKEDLNQTISLE